MGIVYKLFEGIGGERIDKFFKIKNSCIQLLPGNVVMPVKFGEIVEQIMDFKVRPDDIWTISLPRSGSTWTQELIWLLGNNLDFEGAKEIQQLRCPLLELTSILQHDHGEWLERNTLNNSVTYVDKLENQRFIKTHIPLQFLPKELDLIKPKIIYVARNPKDLCVSYYHYCKLLHGSEGTFDDFANDFLNGNLPMCPVWPHMLNFWNKRNESNVLFLKYEDILGDFRGAIEKCATFLNVQDEIMTNENIDKLCEYLKFETMQENAAVNAEHIIYDNHGNNTNVVDTEKKSLRFIRKGKIGDWKNHMSPELSATFDEWIKVNSNGTGLEFEYE